MPSEPRDSLRPQGPCTCSSCHLPIPRPHPFLWFTLPPSALSIISSGKSFSTPSLGQSLCYNFSCLSSGVLFTDCNCARKGVVILFRSIFPHHQCWVSGAQEPCLHVRPAHQCLLGAWHSVNVCGMMLQDVCDRKDQEPAASTLDFQEARCFKKVSSRKPFSHWCPVRVQSHSVLLPSNMHN